MDHHNEYNICINHVARLMERRQAVTTTYLSVTTAITGGIAFLFKEGQLSGWEQELAVIVLMLFGIIACTIWRVLINQYKILLDWWYKQLRSIETSESGIIKIYTKEYQELYVNHKSNIQIGLTRYESYLTWLFTIIYFCFGSALLTSLIIDLI